MSSFASPQESACEISLSPTDCGCSQQSFSIAILSASTAIIRHAEDTARSLGRTSLRIDTHEGNVVMRRMLEKHGFVHRGVIHLENGDPRVAYEKLL